MAALALAGLVVGGVGCGDDDDGAEGDEGAVGEATTTTMATGGIEIDAPEGWIPIPLPALGFGLAIPPEWEATRLDDEALSSVNRASPVVPGFADAAHNAARSGSVFYAAGVDEADRVTDLKVRADIESGVSDLASLEAYAHDLARSAGLENPTVEAVADAAHPTVRIRFRSQSQRSADDGSTVDVAVEGTEQLVLSPRGVVYDLILTSEDPATHDDLAATLLPTLTFPP